MSRTTPRFRPFRRAVVALLLAALALVGLAAPAVAVDPPTVDEVSIAPGFLPSGGGTVSVRAHLYSEADVLGASVTIYLADGSTTSAELQRESLFSEYWTGEVTVPATFSTTSVTHTVEIFAQGVDGQVTQQVVGTVEQEGAPADPAPSVSEVGVAPATRSYDGGPVTVEATVTDDRSVSQVSAVVRTAGGTAVRVPMTDVGGSRYRGSYTVPANPGLSVQRYAVRVEAVDDAGQRTAVVGPRIAVASRAVTTSPGSLDFGHVALGSTRTLATRLTNNTAGSLSVSLTIPASAPYAFAATGSRTTTVPIPAGGTRAVRITFAPTTRGTRAVGTTLRLSQTGQLPLTVSMVGTGVNA